MSVELKLIVDLEYLYIEKLCLWLVERLKDPTQGDDIVLLTEVLYFLTDRIFFDVIDEKNAVNCFVNFDNNNITLLFSKIPSEILKHKRNELLAIKKKIDKIEYNEKEETLIVNKYFFVEDSAFDQELNSAIKDIQEVSVQSSDNIDDSFMSLNAADAENIINRLKNFDKRNLYCFDRFIYDYSSTDILKNLFYFRRAVAGQLLAATQLPIIKSKVFKEIIAGENIASSKDRKAYYSKISGRVRWQGETLEVNAVKSIDQTLKNYVQPLKIDNATLIVNGSLMSCANIVVEKDLYVFGNIIDTNIDVKGNIYVAGRIENCNGAKSVKAGGDIIVLAIYNSIVNTESNLLVSEEIINSDINVGADILLDGENRKIIGGSIKAGRAITCSILGNGETETKILLSADSPANSERKQLIKMREEYENALKSLMFRLRELTEFRDKGIATKEQQFEIREITQKKIKYEKNIELLNKKIDELNTSGSRSDNQQINLRLSVKDTIYPKTYIQMNNASKEIIEEQKEISFIYFKDMIKSGQYTSTRLFENVTAAAQNKSNKTIESIDTNSIRRVMAIDTKDINSGIETAKKFLGLPDEKMIVEQIAQYKNSIKIIVVEKKENDKDSEFLKKYIPIKFEKKETNISAKSTAKKTIDGKTLEECLAKASDLLKIEPTKIKYKILQQSKAGVLGIGAKKCIIEIET